MMPDYYGMALDGPYNGLYVGIQVDIWEAAHAGYWRNEWPGGETVWTLYPPLGEHPIPEELQA
jgi:hypothetical protein